MLKKCFCLLLALAFLFASLITTASAEEVGELEGEIHAFRWGWTYVNSGGDVTKCRVKACDDMLANYNSYYTSAVNHWNTLYSQYGYYDDKVYIYDVPYANSKLDFFDAVSGGWLYEAQYNNIRAVTLYKNSSGNWFVDPDGDEGTFTSGTISYSRIYIKNLSGIENQERNYIFRHEIGHVMGMGHVNPTIPSIMQPYFIPNIYGIKLHDLAVLEDFYPNP